MSENINLKIGVEGLQDVNKLTDNVSKLTKQIDDATKSFANLSKEQKKSEEGLNLRNAIVSQKEELKLLTKELDNAIKANVRFKNAQNDTKVGIKTAFEVVSATVKTASMDAKMFQRDLLGIKFPKIGDSSDKELKILYNAFIQAEKIGNNTFDMLSLATKTFKGDVNQVTLAVAQYNELFEKNPGVDAVTLNTSAFIALRNQVVATGGSVSGLNKEIANMTTKSADVSTFQGLMVNINSYFKDGTLNVGLFSKALLEAKINGAEFTDSLMEGIADYDAVIEETIDSLNHLREYRANPDEFFSTTGNGGDELERQISEQQRLLSNTYALKEAFQDYGTSIQGLKDNVTRLTTEYSKLSIAQREGTEGSTIINQLKATQKEIINAEASLNKLGLTGKTARSSGFDPLANSIMQVGRELPNFAISTQIGFMAISNNLPILGDAITNFREMRDEIIKFNKTADAASQKVVPSMGKSIAKSLFSIGGALTLLSGLFMIFGPTVTKWLGDLFSANELTKKLTNSQLGLLTSTQNLQKTMKDGGGVYYEAVSNIEKFKVQLEKSKGSTELQDKAVQDFNSTLGTTFGEITNVDEGLNHIAKSGDAYIEAMKNMAFANVFFQQSAKDAVKAMEIGMKSQQELLRDAGKDGKKMFEDWQEIDKEIKKAEDEQAKGLNPNAVVTVGGIFGTQYSLEGAKNKRSKMVKEMQKIEKEERERQIAEIAKNQKISLELAEKYYEDYAAIVSKNKFGAGGKSSTTKNDYSAPDLKDDPTIVRAEAVAREVIKWEDWVIIQKTKTALEEERIAKRLSSNKELYDYTVWERYKDEIALITANIEDADKEIDELTAKKSELETFGNKFKDAEKEVKTLYDTLDSTNEILAQQETQLNRLNIKLSEAEKLYDKSKNAKEAETNKKVVDNLKLEIQTREEGIAAIKKTISDIELLITKKNEELAKYKEGSEEYKQVQNQINDLETKIANLRSTRHQTELNEIREKMEAYLELADSVSSLFGGMADLSQGNMDLINAHFDEQIWNENEKVQSAEAREEALHNLDVKRWEALKQDFENQKKWKVAQALMDLASGSVRIWTGVNASTGPLGIAMSIAQQAALAATTAGNIKSILAQQMLKPQRSGGGGAGAGNVPALNPHKDALTSRDENLNMMSKSGEARELITVVKVSEINDVQKKVSVRDNNATL